MTPSPQQQNVFDWVKFGRGSAFCTAVAGAGKTTTLVEAVRLTRGFVNFAAFNKKIAQEIEARIAPLGLGNRVRVGTFHGFGFGAWRRSHSQVKVEDRKKREQLVIDCAVPATVEAFALKLASLAKQRAFTYADMEDESKWWDIVSHYDMVMDLEDVELAPLGVEKAMAVLKASIDMSDKWIDFDDMIYMPVLRGTPMYQNDWLFGDEMQDTNPARRALARKMLKNAGRGLFVGDRAQAIYGFTGADNDAVEQIIDQFNCVELPLTVTFRCPKAVVELAQNYMPDIEAHPSAPEGEVQVLSPEGIFAKELALGPADAILCRKTAPLLSTAYGLIRRGIGCHVEGREIGSGLAKMVRRFGARGLKDMRAKMEKHRDEECEKLKSQGKETQAEALADRIETIFVIADNSGAKNVLELTTAIANMFEDSEGENKPTLTLSSVHKSKGREWDRVFVLGYDTYMPSPWARQAWQVQQEYNLIYVAYTRSKNKLMLVQGPRGS